MLWLLTDPNANYDKIYGLPYSTWSRCGVPYTAITYAFQISKQTGIPMLMRRGQSTIEGQFEIGDRVAIVEDEITNGSNVLEMAVDLVKEGLKIGEALVFVDREQGGRENLANAGIQVKSLYRITELIDYLREAGKIPAYGRAIIRDNSKVIESSKQINQDHVKNRNTRRRGFV